MVAFTTTEIEKLTSSVFFLNMNLQLSESETPIEELTRTVQDQSLNIVQLAKLKRMAEKFAKLVFLDTDFQPVIFANKLKRTFTNYSPLIITQEFADMLKNIA
jgi:hypothetical protein